MIGCVERLLSNSVAAASGRRISPWRRPEAAATEKPRRAFAGRGLGAQIDGWPITDSFSIVVLLVRVFQFRVRGGGLAVDVVARTLEMIHALAAAERGIPGIGQLRLLHLLRLHVVTIHVLIVLIIGVVGFQASVRRGGSSETGIAGTGLQIGSLILPEGRITVGAVAARRRDGGTRQGEAGNDRETQHLFSVYFHELTLSVLLRAMAAAAFPQRPGKYHALFYSFVRLTRRGCLVFRGGPREQSA